MLYRLCIKAFRSNLGKPTADLLKSLPENPSLDAFKYSTDEAAWVKN